MQIKKVTITPSMAKAWMETNKQNRSFSRSTALKYAADMKAGLWQETHQNAIAFYEDGRLADGQHRLSAITEAGIPVDMWVATDLPNQAINAIDQGRSRSMADVMKLNGVIENGKYASYIVGMMNVIRSAENFFTRSATAAELEAAICKMSNGINFANQSLTNSKGSLKNSYVRAALCTAYYSVDNEMLQKFAEVLVSGMAKGPIDQTVVTVRNRILTTPSGGTGIRSEHYRVLLRFIKAYDEGRILTMAKATSELTFRTGIFDK